MLFRLFPAAMWIDEGFQTVSRILSGIPAREPCMERCEREKSTRLKPRNGMNQKLSSATHSKSVCMIPRIKASVGSIAICPHKRVYQKRC